MRDHPRLLDARDGDESAGDERPRKRRRHGRPIVSDETRLQGADEVIAGELVADVHHVRAQRAGGKRAVADLLEKLLPLSEIHRDRDDFRAVLVRQPGNGDGRRQPPRMRQHYALHADSV